MAHWMDRLASGEQFDTREWVQILSQYQNEAVREVLFDRARQTAKRYYGNAIYVRGLIEFTNYCKNDCFYCGIRRSNACAQRYRLTKEDILSCCKEGYALGFRTFVLQGGEDGHFTDERMCDIVSAIRAGWPDCAITLSIGERSEESYRRLFAAGANRYLLRHETADPEHYARLHPQGLTLEHRKACLYALKRIGYQVGSGFMVGSPHQTLEHLAQDLQFLAQLRPHMVGIGPFIPHKDTPFKDFKAGSLEMTVYLLGILRLMLPNALLPATTALGTISPKGREMGILAGANVVMPNLSPLSVRKKYLLYDNKIATGEEAAEHLAALQKRMQAIGYTIVTDRGDCKPAAKGNRC